jgi:hypothetical protein
MLALNDEDVLLARHGHVLLQYLDVSVAREDSECFSRRLGVEHDHDSRGRLHAVEFLLPELDLLLDIRRNG